MLETQLLGKFGNSLKLRMGIRIADVPAMSAKAQSAITTAVSGGVFQMQIMQLYNTVRCSNTNPVWVDLVQSGRSDFVIANTLVDLNNLSDPRRSAYFDQNLGAGFTKVDHGENNFFSYTHVSVISL
jgi:hypothetical protein